MKRPLRYTETVTIHLPPGTLARMEAVQPSIRTMPQFRRGLLLTALSRHEAHFEFEKAHAEKCAKARKRKAP